MTEANKIKYENVGTYEIIIAKCGALRLIWFANPRGGNKYEVYAGDEKIVETVFLRQAIGIYNELVQ